MQETTSAPLMQVFPFPSSFPYVDLEMFRTPFERFQFSSLAAGFRMFEGKVLEVGAHQTGQGRVAFDGDLADLLHQFLVDGESDVHKHINT